MISINVFFTVYCCIDLLSFFFFLFDIIEEVVDTTDIEDESNCYPLEIDENSNELYHPETGELITDMANVCHYFTLTERGKSISKYT